MIKVLWDEISFMRCSVLNEAPYILTFMLHQTILTYVIFSRISWGALVLSSWLRPYQKLANRLFKDNISWLHTWYAHPIKKKECLREDVAIPISLTVIVLKYKLILGCFFRLLQFRFNKCYNRLIGYLFLSFKTWFFTKISFFTRLLHFMKKATSCTYWSFLSEKNYAYQTMMM